MENYQRKYIGAADFVVFIGMLFVSTFVGIYFAWKDRKNNSTKNYYFGNGMMNPISVGMSLAVTGLSAITVVGIPAEIYLVGTVFAWSVVAIAIVSLCTTIYIVPVFYNLKSPTIYHYLELRFNKTTRRLCAVMVTIYKIFYMGSTIYLPALSLTAISPMPLTWSIVLTAVLCTIYTTLGGIKAVIWTDVFQATIMLIGQFAVFVRGVVVIGGFSEISASLERGERHNFFNMSDFHVSSRATSTAIFIGIFFVFTNNVSYSQASFQRFQSCKSVRKAQLSMIIYGVTAVPISLMAFASGLLMYAYYETCDPVYSKQIQKLDQGISYMAIQIFQDIPGMTGLFVAAIYSGCLSTVSSGINSFSAVILEDFISQKWKNLKERSKLITGKVIAFILGLLVMAVAFALSVTTSNVIQIFGKVGGVVGGPVIGLFILGLFLPWTNSVGAIVGMVTGFCVISWMLIGSMCLRTATPSVKLPPRTTEYCYGNLTFDNTSLIEIMEISNTTLKSMTASDERMSFDQVIYNINFHYYLLIGVIVTIIVALITSFITGHSKPSELDPNLFVPLLDNRIFPPKLRKFFRFGVPEIRKTDFNNVEDTEFFDNKNI